jgi:hypothetical protein
VLNIGCIEVQNWDQNEDYSEAVKNGILKKYRINISGIGISMNDRPLTNNFNFMLNVEMT